MSDSGDAGAPMERLEMQLMRLSTSVDERFAQVDRRFEQVDERFRLVLAEIASEGERTRRHFDLVAEQMRADFNLALDKVLAVDERLTAFETTNASEHARFDRRLSTLETRRKRRR